MARQQGFMAADNPFDEYREPLTWTAWLRQFATADPPVAKSGGESPLDLSQTPLDGREAYEQGLPPSCNPFCERQEIGKWITWAKAWIEASEEEDRVHQGTE